LRIATPFLRLFRNFASGKKLQCLAFQMGNLESIRSILLRGSLLRKSGRSKLRFARILED